MNHRDQIYHLVAQGRTPEALQQCVQLLADRRASDRQLAGSVYREVVILSNRWQSLAEKVRLGTLPVTEEQVEKNRITNSLLTLLETFADEFENKPTGSQQEPRRTAASSHRKKAKQTTDPAPRPQGIPNARQLPSGKTVRGEWVTSSPQAPPNNSFAALFGAIASNRRNSQKGRNLQIVLTLSEEQLRSGIRKTIKLDKQIECPTCSGTGAKHPDAYTACSTCRGRGVTYYERPGSDGLPVRYENPCTNCRGTGRIVKEVCHTCMGNGISTGSVRLMIDLPPGLRDGGRIRFAGLGDSTADDRPTGDFYVLLRRE